METYSDSAIAELVIFIISTLFNIDLFLSHLYRVPILLGFLYVVLTVRHALPRVAFVRWVAI